MEKCKYLILGHGLTAEALIKKMKENEPKASIVSTSRRGAPFLTFDLQNPSSWFGLPRAEVTFWTFPPEPFSMVQKFFSEQREKLNRLIVVGSTSALSVTKEHEEVNEETPLDLTIERVQSEVFLMNQGATLVLSSGIYGEGRNPLDWVRNGFVGKSEKYVNMVHVDDLAQFLYNAALFGKEKAVYIASNNNPQRWSEIISLWESKGLVSSIAAKESRRSSKRVDCSRSIKDLRVNLRFENFAESIS